MPRLNKVIDKVVDFIEANRQDGPIDVQSLFVKMTLDAIGVIAFDFNLGGVDNSRQFYDLILQTGFVARLRYFNTFNRLYCKLCPRSKEAQRQNYIVGQLTAEWNELTKAILARDDPPDGEEPIWFVLKTMKNPDTDERLPYNTLRSELATLVLAGMDTTGHQLGWLFALLASNPQVIEKQLEELRNHGLFRPDSRELTFEDLGELTYLTAVIKEAMRLGHIIRCCFLRFVPEDRSILGYRIPKGTVILCPGTRAMNTEAEWEDPLVFRPERWLTDEDMSYRYSLGFGFGSRDCVGQKLAMFEMRVVIVKLLVRYQFTLEGTMKELFDNAKDGAVIQARHGIWLHIVQGPEP